MKKQDLLFCALHCDRQESSISLLKAHTSPPLIQRTATVIITNLKDLSIEGLRLTEGIKNLFTPPHSFYLCFT